MREAQAAPPPGGPRGAAGAPEPDTGPGSTVLRIVVDGPGWARSLPPVPHGATVTVTCSDLELLTDRLELEQLGYTFAGVCRNPLLPPGVEAADLLVPAALVDEHPAWWQEAAACADRAFPLAFGPVLRLLGDLLRVHDLAVGPA